MGGTGSGLWERTNAKRTTESLLQLDINELIRKSLLKRGLMGTLDWTNSRTGEVLSRVAYRVIEYSGEPCSLLIAYVWNEWKSVQTQISLDKTFPHFGGERFWFRCPHRDEEKGVICSRRVSKLYLRDGKFACRLCHDLTYESCQDSSFARWKKSLWQWPPISRSLANA